MPTNQSGLGATIVTRVTSGKASSMKKVVSVEPGELMPAPEITE
jgi:hypothetical protein